MKKNIVKILSFIILTCILIGSFSILSFALSFTYDGSGYSGSGSSDSVSDPSYSIQTTTTTANVVGYRFSPIDKDGKKKGHSIDIYESSYILYYKGGSRKGE